MRVAFKETVRLDAVALVEGQLGEALVALAATAPTMIDDVVVITSANDSQHGKRSLHYSDEALDVRFLGIRPGGIAVEVGTPAGRVRAIQTAAAQAWRDRLREHLGDAFDVVLEADHLHLEFDPS